MTRSSVRFYGWSKVRPRAGLDVVMRYNEIGNGAWCNKEAKKKKEKRKGKEKRNLFFAPFANRASGVRGVLSETFIFL